MTDDNIAEALAAVLSRKVAHSAREHTTIAAGADISQHLLTRILRGTHQPSTSTFIRICHALGLDAGKVMSDVTEAAGEKPQDPYDGRTFVPILPRRKRPDARSVGLVLDPGASAYLPQPIVEDLTAAIDSGDREAVDRVIERANTHGWQYARLGDAVGLTVSRASQRAKAYRESGKPLSDATYPYEPSYARRQARKEVA